MLLNLIIFGYKNPNIFLKEIEKAVVIARCLTLNIIHSITMYTLLSTILCICPACFEPDYYCLK